MSSNDNPRDLKEFKEIVQEYIKWRYGDREFKWVDWYDDTKTVLPRFTCSLEVFPFKGRRETQREDISYYPKLKAWETVHAYASESIGIIVETTKGAVIRRAVGKNLWFLSDSNSLGR